MNQMRSFPAGDRPDPILSAESSVFDHHAESVCSGNLRTMQLWHNLEETYSFVQGHSESTITSSLVARKMRKYRDQIV